MKNPSLTIFVKQQSNNRYNRFEYNRQIKQKHIRAYTQQFSQHFARLNVLCILMLDSKILSVPFETDRQRLDQIFLGIALRYLSSDVYSTVAKTSLFCKNTQTQSESIQMSL